MYLIESFLLERSCSCWLWYGDSWTKDHLSVHACSFHCSSIDCRMCHCYIGEHWSFRSTSTPRKSLSLGLSGTCFELRRFRSMSIKLETSRARLVERSPGWSMYNSSISRRDYVSFESLGWSSGVECRFLSNSQRHHRQWNVNDQCRFDWNRIFFFGR